MTALAPTLQSFFTDYLVRQRDASLHTILAYRDTFRLLLAYTQQRTGIAPSDLDIAIINAELIGDFLTMSQAGFRGDLETRDLSLEQGTPRYATIQEVPGGAA
jgi:site-specific recombinase XerC